MISRSTTAAARIAFTTDELFTALSVVSFGGLEPTPGHQADGLCRYWPSATIRCQRPSMSTDLILKSARSRPGGPWADDDYDVLQDGKPVGAAS